MHLMWTGIQGLSFEKALGVGVGKSCKDLQSQGFYGPLLGLTWLGKPRQIHLQDQGYAIYNQS